MTNRSTDMDGNLLRLLPDTFLRLDERGNVVAHVSGGEGDPLLDAAGMVGRPLSEVLPADTAARVNRQIRRVLKTRDASAIDFSLGPRGREQHYEFRVVVSGRRSVLGVIRRMDANDSDAGRGRAQAGPLEYGDFIRELDAALCDARLRERGLALMSVGFEQIPGIRRALGHGASDAVLQVARTRIDNCLRDGDRLQPTAGQAAGTGFAQIAGSGEFALMLRDVDERDAARQVAVRVQQAFEQPVTLDGHQFEITPHLGSAFFPYDGEGAEELLQNSRRALDEARVRGGGPHQFYTDTTRFRVRRRLDTGNELRWAIDNDQLELRYLPRIDLGTGIVAGLEALLRWAHPLRGQIGLDEVLPIAQTCGLMPAIGEWVLDAACRQAAAWREHWQTLPPVSINLSPQEFGREDLPLLVQAALARRALPPSALELEITEAMLMREEKSALQLQRLHRLGVAIVIDDFGRGYSSVNRMTELPIDAIKIDRPIVDRCREGGSGGAVCAAIIAMASHLGLTVIAEGVETVEQINFLREHGCDALQGFFFTEPLPGADVPGFLAAHLGTTPEGDRVDLATIRSRFALHGTG